MFTDSDNLLSSEKESRRVHRTRKQIIIRMCCVQPKLLVTIVNTNFVCDTISRYKKCSEEMLDVEIKKFIIQECLNV